MVMERAAIYPGSFDPITNGHVDIIRRALDIFDRVIVAVGIQHDKKPLFSLNERVSMIRQSIQDPRLEVVSFSGLLVDFARKRGIKTIIRSMRAVSDFDYEFQMALINREMLSGCETLFLMPSKEWLFLSSSAVRELAKNHAEIKTLVPEIVAGALKKKYR